MPVWLNWLLLLEMLVICVPNFLAILVTIRVRRLRRNSGNMFIVAFALNDFVTGLVVIPLGLIHEIEYVASSCSEDQVAGEGPGVGQTFCDVLQSSINYTGMLSVWFMALIAADRYYRISNENYKRWLSWRRALLLVAGTHVACSFSTLVFFVSHKGSGLQYEESQCVYYITSSFATFAFASVFGFVPFFFMIYYYYKLAQMSRYDPRDDVQEEGVAVAVVAGGIRDGGAGGGCCCCGLACGFFVHAACCSKRTSHSEAPPVDATTTAPAVARKTGERIEMATVLCGSAAARTTSGGDGSLATSTTRADGRTKSGAACSSGGGSDRESGGDAVSGKRSGSLIRARMRKQSRKAQQLIRLIVYAYCCCVFPPYIVYLVFTFAKWAEIEKTPWFYAYPWVSFLNSAVNPFIYFFISKEARTKTILLLRQRFSF